MFMQKLFTISQVTFKEMIRQPVYGIILVLGSIMIYVSPWLSMFTLLNSDKLVRDMGLATVLLSAVLIAAFLSSGLMFREMENKTTVTILSKPVYRLEFLLGKYFGLMAGIFLVVLQLTIVLVFTMRMGVPETVRVVLDRPVRYTLNTIGIFSFIWAVVLNYFFEKPFTSSLVKTMICLFVPAFLIISVFDSHFHLQSFGTGMELGLLKAGLLIFMAMSILTAIALLGSIRFNMLANLLFCISIFFMTMTCDYFFGRFANDNFVSQTVYWIIPNLQFFWVADAFLSHNTIPLKYLAVTSVYSCISVCFILILSWLSFSEKEVS